MKLFRKLITGICIISVGIVSTSCNTKFDNSLNGKPSQLISLIYYTIGTPDKDLSLVNTELNKILKPKKNITIQYNKIPWGEYGAKITTMINSGIYFDIAFASSFTQGDFIGNAKKGAWLALDSFLEFQGKEMYNAISPLYWEGMRYNGNIYGIPTNKEIAVPEHFTYCKKLIDKYNIDITKYNSLESLQPILSIIHEKESDYIGFELDNQARNYFKIDGYESLIDNKIPIMVNSNDEKLNVVNILETDLGYKRLKTIREYYKAGYINEDAALKESAGLNKGEKVFCRIASGGPFSKTLWSTDRGYEIVSHIVSPKVVTNESARGGIMVVNSKTKYPEQCIEFLNILNTDPQVRNLINFGIEERHYTLTKHHQVKRISNAYTGVQYTQGNMFILNTMVGEPQNKWNVFKEFNKDAYTSQVFGFNPDLVLLDQKISQIHKVCDKYYSSIMTGSVDIDKYLPMYIDELNQAGIQEVKNELQSQINEWLKNKS